MQSPRLLMRSVQKACSLCPAPRPSEQIFVRLLGFPGGSDGKESTRNAGDLGSIPGLGKSPEEGKGYPLQYFGLQNSTDCITHSVTKSLTRLTFTFTEKKPLVFKIFKYRDYIDKKAMLGIRNNDFEKHIYSYINN